MMPVVSW